MVMIDELDARILGLWDAEPRVGVLEASRRLRVARGTVQARLDKLLRKGVIASLAPRVDPAALGYPLTAFATLEIRQADRAAVIEHLSRVPEVLEVLTITGPGDLFCRIVARDTEDLQRVLDDLTTDDDVVRSSTTVALSTVLAQRIQPLVRAAAASAPSAGVRALS
jgi:DNA-binding Lrp family transcriptional regulator